MHISWIQDYFKCKKDGGIESEIINYCGQISGRIVANSNLTLRYFFTSQYASLKNATSA